MMGVYNETVTIARETGKYVIFEKQLKKFDNCSALGGVTGITNKYTMGLQYRERIILKVNSCKRI